jgi:REP element-mobilizing transposase RayT
MPRTPRVDFSGAVQHVMARGIERRRIFLDDDDRRDFVARLSRILPEEQAPCLAWALMPNHFHLLLWTTHGGLSRAMARLGTGYALAFNRRHDRVGHLFQNRFKSRRAVDDADLAGLVAYVNGNPLAGGVVSSLDELASFPWCGHGALMGGRAPHPFEAVSSALSAFAEDPGEARRGLLDWMSRSEERAAQAPFSQREPASQPTPAAVAPELHPPASPEHLDEALRDLIADAALAFGVEAQALRSGSRVRAVAAARTTVAYRAVVERGLAASEVARVLGVSASAVSHALGRGGALAREGASGRSRGK